MTDTNLPNDLSTVARKLDQLDVTIEEMVRRNAKRNSSFFILSLILFVFLIGYLGYAYHRFGGEITPDLIAANAQSSFEMYAPQTRHELAAQLVANAPRFVGGAFDQVQQLPDRFAGQLDKEASARIDAAMPAVQDSLYGSLNTALDTAKANTHGSDEQRFQAMLDAVGQVYGAETLKFVDQVHTTYSTQAVDFINYLDRLNSGVLLSHRDQLYRDMFRNMFILIREHAKQSGQIDPLKSTLLEPAQ